MIIENGVLAKALSFEDSEKLQLFASGFSNSLETGASEFQRETILLNNKHILICAESQEL